MAKYENPAELDYRNGGDTVDDFAQKYMRTVDYIIKALNDLRTPTGNTAGVEPEPYMWRIADNKLYIRNGDNTDYVLLGEISPNFGFRSSVNDRFLTTADLEGDGAVVTRNEAGKVEGDITGSPGKIAGKTIDVTPSADNDVIAYDAAQQKWVKKTLNDYLKKQGDAGWDEMVDEVADQVIEDITPIIFNFWYLDDDGYLVPLVGSTEGGLPSIHGMVGDYEQITARSVDVAGNVSATGNVTAGMVTTPQANVNTLTANVVNAGTLTANDIIAKGPIVDVRAFGAKGDGVHDDTQAIQAAASNAEENAIIFFPPGKYIISESIKFDYTDLGKVNRKLAFVGDSAELFLTGTGYYAFNFIFDSQSEQNTKICFKGFTVKTNNVNRPSFLKTNYGCWVEVRNCNFYQVTNALEFNYGLRCDVYNCSFWGCTIGVIYNRTRDSLVTGCHAFNCDYGFKAEGVGDVGTDGNIEFTDCVANGCNQYGIYLKGLYTPHISDIMIETCPVGLYVYNCNYLLANMLWIGPCASKSIVIDADDNNQYCNISNLSLQTEAQFSKMLGANISGINAYAVSNIDNDCALKFINVSYSTIRDITAREITCANAIDITGTETLLEGGKVEGNIKLGTGIYINAVFVRNIYNVTVDGQIAEHSYLNYIQYEGTNHSTRNRKIIKSIYSDYVSASTSQDVDISNYVQQPGDLGHISYVTFLCTCGTYGSESGAIVQAIRTKDALKTNVINTIDNVGSGKITASNSNITINNTTGNLSILATIRIIDEGEY